ncbi:hypothetical protein, conserved [Eimeria maxima]|uniref:CS domain-containing protein n=1 Tax=Eimeria maxima TaxID=5804 RepID=U6M5B1_EIMMA|nr:hypothetical protein, conserved [Eimeria maxima]CDJ56865.1 hypothetical protein, conserved [Eimeria maxima]
MPNTIAYQWSQTVTHLSLRLRIPFLKGNLQQEQRDRQLSVILASCYLRVCWPPWLLEIDFWGDVAFRSATVTPGVECLTIIVPKAEEGMWGSLTAASNPKLQQNITERRQLSLAAYTEWQEQLQQQRIAAREARKQQQQKHVWRQEQEQREWHKRQKEIQVQQVLEQLPDSGWKPPSCTETHDDANRPLDGDQAWEKVQELSEANTTEDASGSREGRQELQARGDACHAPVLGEGSYCSVTLGEEEDSIVAYDGKQDDEAGKAQVETSIPPGSTQRGAGFLQASRCTSDEALSTASISTDPVLCGHRAQPISSTNKNVALPEVHLPVQPCTKVKVSFAARRPNRVPARGPLPAPLPKAELDLARDICTREKPEDLCRQQEANPAWLHSKATRLLISGDAAAADEAYSLILHPAKHHCLHRLAFIKALSGRSLARLSLGDAEKVKQELHREEDAAAAVAGQLQHKGLIHEESLYLQHVLLARRAAAFLRLDALEEAAKSLEELLELKPSQTPSTVYHTHADGNCKLDNHRTAVFADLMHIRRLQHLRKVKEEADNVLQLALATHQEWIAVHSPLPEPQEAGCSHEKQQPATVDGNDPSCDVAQTEPVPEFTTVASLLQAAVQASTTENSFFPFPVAAATVLASMALALMQLQQSSSASVAGSALTTAEILIQHAEERLKLQQIETLRSLSPTEEAVDKADHDRLMSSRGPTEYPHCPSTRYSAGHLGVLHQVRLHLYYALHNPALLSFVVTVNTISLKEPRENHCALGTWIHNFHEIVATRARELACLLLASLEPRLPSAACKQTPN